MLEFEHLHTRGSGPNPNTLDPKAQSIWLVWTQLFQAFTICAEAPLKKGGLQEVWKQPCPNKEVGGCVLIPSFVLHGRCFGRKVGEMGVVFKLLDYCTYTHRTKSPVWKLGREKTITPNVKTHFDNLLVTFSFHSAYTLIFTLILVCTQSYRAF